MPARQFLIWNIVGAVLWVDGILLIGYLLAEQIYHAIGDKIDHVHPAGGGPDHR